MWLRWQLIIYFVDGLVAGGLRNYKQWRRVLVVAILLAIGVACDIVFKS